jgi:hypothetical protein
MRLHTDVHYATITSTMKEGNDIYDALRGALRGKIGPLHNIIVWHPTLKQKVRLDYKHLQSDVAYRIEVTLGGRQQGPGVSASGGYKKVQKYTKAIREYWQLGDDSEILPEDIAPRDREGNLVAPCNWPARFTVEVRKLSEHSVRRHEVALGYLVAVVEARRERGEYPREVTSGDCKAAMAWMMASTADQAYAQLPEERADTRLFAGGLAEAAQQALEETEGEGAMVGSEYEEGGKFNIGTHFRSV